MGKSAKQLGVTRERMRQIEEKMEGKVASLPLDEAVEKLRADGYRLCHVLLGEIDNILTAPMEEIVVEIQKRVQIKSKKTTADQTAKLATLNKELAAIRASFRTAK
jgi:hypothetical protein